ncbi:MAG: gamma-glutamyltransferase [Candidatus Promineifilaceae bacterium]|nr:gamma-glutamyltransferase [Candidatus Promineifilaceae bacterium]
MTDLKKTKLAGGSHGMVSSAHPLASKVGRNILRQGGNAFDAAVAVAAALNVVEPMMSGMGGYGTILIYAAHERKCRFLNTSGRIPQNIDSDLFRPPTPHYKANRRGALAISTPVNVRGWQALSEEYGKLRWRDILEPAVELAQNGFLITEVVARDIQRYFTTFPAHAQRIYSNQGIPLKTGDLLVQKDLAQSLSLIAIEGPDFFYSGSLGKKIIQSIQLAGGVLSQADMIRCAAEWYEPLSVCYGEHRIFTASPPATSFAALIRLGLMSQFDVASLGHNSADYLHLFAEATKFAYRCRLQYAADPDITVVPFQELLSEEYWQKSASQLNLTRAIPFQDTWPVTKSGPHTTHFVVADEVGNIVSATQTIGQMFGSRIMPTGSGIWMNNSLQYCSFEPQGNPMDAHAGRRKLSGDCPVIILRNDQPVMALGTPGGHTITQTVPQIILNLLVFEMNMAQAIAQPRISFEEPDQILFDAHLPDDVQMDLRSKGHRMQKFMDGLGNAHGVNLEYDKPRRPVAFAGAADPRGEGLAVGI